MAQLLLEILSEEIPARMQARAEGDLARLLGEALEQAGLQWDSLETFAGPRRLTAVVEGLPEATEAVREERKGPRQGAPDKAIEGFLRSAGLDSLEQCETRDDGKGPYYVAVIGRPGRKTADVIAEAVPAIARGFPWPKSMKFGEGARAQRWVRPLRRILCLFGGAVVPAEVFGIKAGNETEGHRVHGPGPFVVKDFADYEKTLREKGHVILRAGERKRIILEQARAVCSNAGLELLEDEGLLAELAGLAEWPVALLGDMAAEFLDLPPEAVRLSMKTHQKYFAVRDPETGALAPKFVVIANQVAPDGGEAIAAGNARVLSARLNDARYFWDNDRATGLSAMAEKLSAVTFHNDLGSMADKTARVAALARELAPAVGADPELAERAAKLAKADLVSEMVYEFPELQGVMGRYLHRHSHGLYVASVGPSAFTHDASIGVQGSEAKQAIAVADAIRDHYKPQGLGDAVPTAPVSAAVALADKLDTLVGFWAIDEKPTGSKDPFALRRAALGVIRISHATNVQVSLGDTISAWFDDVGVEGVIERSGTEHAIQKAWPYMDVKFGDEYHRTTLGEFTRKPPKTSDRDETIRWHDECRELLISRIRNDLLSFFADRLKVHLRDEGIRHDVIDAVFALGDDDLVRVTAKSRALQAFLDTEDGAALLAGYRRAANILKIEEKKDGASYDAEPEAAYLKAPPQAEEKALIAALAQAVPAARKAVQAEDFAAAMAALAALRAPVDAFFDSVTVNADDAKLRANRLRLLSRIRAAAAAVADFGRIEG
ncbi:MAG: glycine--tRNA ligase subunit beta [Maricaulaceae bacterium]|nr:glycine--tRNA ligase subunit beta [Maricaulaceae bacterium]